jgi:hypothetical protein
MKHLIRNAFVAILSVGLASCEWGGSEDGNSWNDSSSIANFSGNYHANGGYLVSDYTTSGSTTTSTTAGQLNVSDENKGAIPSTSFAGQCNMTPVKAGSFHLSIDGGTGGQFTDNGSGGLSGSFNIGSGVMQPATGTLNYDNGAYGINLGVLGGPVVGKTVTITYTVLTAAGGTTTTTGSGTSGSSGVSIMAFNVQQSGNKVKIIDNNGSVYEGSLGDVRTTGNLSSSSSGSGLVAGDQVIAPFSAAGKSKSGMYVNLAGNFQGTVAGVSSVNEVSGSTTTIKTSFALSDRVILGTWIEDGGKTGDINGRSSSAANVSFSTSTSTNSP